MKRHSNVTFVSFSYSERFQVDALHGGPYFFMQWLISMKFAYCSKHLLCTNYTKTNFHVNMRAQYRCIENIRIRPI